MAVGLPLKTTYADGDVYSASDVNDTNGTVNAFVTGGQTAGKNAIIGGGFDIWQRGTSFTNGNGTAIYGADRWHIYSTTFTGRTWSRQATSDTTNLPFIQYCLRVARNNADTQTNIVAITSDLESVTSIPMAGKTVTFSFYARKGANFSAASNALTVALIVGTGTDQNSLTGFAGQSPIVNSTATLTSTWQRFTYTAAVPSTTTQIGTQIYYVPVGTAGATDYFEITGVQLEVGGTATPFSRAGGTIQGELAACQRYYYRYSGTSTVTTGLGIGSSGTLCRITYINPVTMRVSPTSVDYSNLQIYDSVGTVNGTTATIGYAQPEAVNLSFNAASGITAYRSYFASFSGSGYIGFSAEL